MVKRLDFQAIDCGFESRTCKIFHILEIFLNFGKITLKNTREKALLFRLKSDSYSHDCVIKFLFWR